MARRRSHRRRSNPRRHRAHARRHNAPRHHRRRRRNPFGFSTAGIMGQVKRGASNGFGVLVGRVGSRALPDLTGISTSISSGGMGSTTATAALAAAQLASGILLAMLFKGFGSEFANYIVAGAFDGVYEDVATSFSGSVPVIGKYLGGYSSTLPALARASIGGYSRSVPRTVSPAGGSARVGPSGLRRIGVGAAARVAK